MPPQFAGLACNDEFNGILGVMTYFKLLYSIGWDELSATTENTSVRMLFPGYILNQISTEYESGCVGTIREISITITQ
jgi:vacuolar-type H+-ATPase subunit B/Vma2